jgi:serine phosphatase RsbU (regulator of sigma subunit)
VENTGTFIKYPAADYNSRPFFCVKSTESGYDTDVEGTFMATSPSFFTGITGRRWTGLVLVWLTILILFALLYNSARRSVLNEIRHQAMAVAVAAAAAVSPDDIAQIHDPADAGKDAYKRIQNYFGHIIEQNPDVRYLYAMRRSGRDKALNSDFEYIVDAAARDVNRNGIIDKDEGSEPPGKPYSAHSLPEMINAWYKAGADPGPSPDPPYPDLLSGYAPVHNELGQTVAVVGADITAATVHTKLFALRGVIFLVWLVLSLLIMMVVQLYYQQNEALEKNKALSEQLSRRNEMLRAANLELLKHNEEFQRELRLARSVQPGLASGSSPRPEKVSFDKFFMTAEMAGGGLFDVFMIDDDHAGFYVASVASRGAGAALISGVLKMAAASGDAEHARMTGHLRAQLTHPEMVLATLNDLLAKELPEHETVAMIYAVLDPSRYRLSISSAGHMTPIVFSQYAGTAARRDVLCGPVLGHRPGTEYPVVRMDVSAGDKIIFHTDGLLAAVGDEAGEKNLLKLLQKKGRVAPAEIVSSVQEAAPADDYSILVAEIR